MSSQSLAAVLLGGFESISTLFETVDAFLAVDQHEELHAAEFEFEDRMALVPSPSSDWPIILEACSRFRDSLDIWYANETATARALSGSRSVELSSSPLSENDMVSLPNTDLSATDRNGGESLNSSDASDREGATAATEPGRINSRNLFSRLVNNDRNRDSSSKSIQLARGYNDVKEAVDNIVREKDDAREANTACCLKETKAKDHEISKEKDQTESSIHDYETNENDEAGPSIHDYDLDEEDFSAEVEAGSSFYVDQNVEAGPSTEYDQSTNGDEAGPSMHDYDLDEELSGEEEEATGTEGDPSIQDYNLREEEDADVFTRQSGLDKDDRSIENDERDWDYINDSSGLVASSCAACLLPDSDSMIQCDNHSVHIDGETWYHYGCVKLTADTVPEGEWHCPPCREKEKKRHSEQQKKSTKILIKQKDFGEPSLKRPKKPKRKVVIAKPNVKPETTDENQEISHSKDGAKTTNELGNNQESLGSSVEDRRLFETLKEFMEDETVPKRFRFSELKWKVVRKNLLEHYGYDRTHSSIKNTYTRRLREKFGFDERSERKRNPNKMRTSVESPESRKRKRQAKAQANDQPPSRKKSKGQARKEDAGQTIAQDVGSSNDCQGNPTSTNNVTDQETRSGDLGQASVNGSTHVEDHLEPHDQLYDWARFKNNGKRKREQEEEEEEEEDEDGEAWDRLRKMLREFGTIS